MQVYEDHEKYEHYNDTEEVPISLFAARYAETHGAYQQEEEKRQPCTDDLKRRHAVYTDVLIFYKTLRPFFLLRNSNAIATR